MSEIPEETTPADEPDSGISETTPVDRGATPGDNDTLASGKSPQVAGLRGRKIGPYTLLKELGHGGQGYVFLAEDERLHRRVALKVLATHAAMSLSAQARISAGRGTCMKDNIK